MTHYCAYPVICYGNKRVYVFVLEGGESRLYTMMYDKFLKLNGELGLWYESFDWRVPGPKLDNLAKAILLNALPKKADADKYQKPFAEYLLSLSKYGWYISREDVIREIDRIKGDLK